MAAGYDYEDEKRGWTSESQPRTGNWRGASNLSWNFSRWKLPLLCGLGVSDRVRFAL